MKRISIGSLCSLIVIFYSCSETIQEPRGPTPFTLDIPAGFPEQNIQEDNPITQEGVELGRKLFYDSIISNDGLKACATCHIQANSFSSNPSVIPHINLGWSHNFLWNGAVTGHVEDAMRFEVEDFFNTDLSKLNNHTEYPSLFEKVFGTTTITTKEIAYALAQFERTMISGNSKFDKVQRGEAEFTNAEEKGMQMFFTEKADCFHCHATVFFTDNLLHNNALDASPEPGLFEVTGDTLDYGKFKSPTLRNIEYTSPYMHDGRFKTLEEVVDFYSDGLKHSTTVDPLMTYLYQGGNHLTAEEKTELVAFLKTLSDPSYLTNPQFSNPNNTSN